MRGINKILLTLIGLAMLLSCSKDKNMDNAKPYEDNFKFFFKAKINGIPMEINAGAGGYVLNTNYSVADSVLNMWGTLSKDNDSLRNSVTIRLRGAEEVVDPAWINISSMLPQGAYAYRTPTGYKVDPLQFDFQMLPDSIGGGVSHQWLLPDGTISYQNQLAVRRFASSSDTFSVKLFTSFPTNCYPAVKHYINPQMLCDGSFDIVKSPNYDIQFLAYSTKGDLKNTNWYINGNYVDTGNITNVGLLSGYVKVKAVLEFESGCEKVVEKFVFLNNSGLNVCQTDFEVEKKAVWIADPKQLATVEVIYYDAFGKKYTSNFAGNEGKFQLQSLKSYKKNELDQQTSRFLFEGATVLKSADGSTVMVSDAFGNFVVAHP